LTNPKRTRIFVAKKEYRMIFSVPKKVYAFIFCLSFFFSLLSTSCERKTKSNDNEVIFDTIQVNKTQSIDYKKTKLDCKLNIVFNFPVACKKTFQLSDLQNIFIEKMFPPQYVNLSPQDAVEHFSEQYIRIFQSINFEDFIDEDYMLEVENDYIYELYLENEILFNKNNFISFGAYAVDTQVNYAALQNTMFVAHDFCEYSLVLNEI
jgi:hypothetical protein